MLDPETHTHTILIYDICGGEIEKEGRQGRKVGKGARKGGRKERRQAMSQGGKEGR